MNPLTGLVRLGDPELVPWTPCGISEEDTTVEKSIRGLCFQFSRIKTFYGHVLGTQRKPRTLWGQKSEQGVSLDDSRILPIPAISSPSTKRMIHIGYSYPIFQICVAAMNACLDYERRGRICKEG